MASMLSTLCTKHEENSKKRIMMHDVWLQAHSNDRNESERRIPSIYIV